MLGQTVGVRTTSPLAARLRTEYAGKRFTSEDAPGSVMAKDAKAQSLTADRRLAELYRRYGPTIYARCRRLLRDEVAAEDATQEVFLRVFRHIESAPSDQAALAWIYRISTNFCLNHIRDRSRQAEPVESLPEEVSDHPEPPMLDKDLAMRLLNRAPEYLRAPAILYYVDGLEQAQVAELLGISRRTVINRLNEFGSRARKFAARDDISLGAEKVGSAS